ncbi:MAG: hypothetical protein V4772_15560 [Pseudomonadota bacterium]
MGCFLQHQAFDAGGGQIGQQFQAAFDGVQGMAKGFQFLGSVALAVKPPAGLC